jgi:hypothetical protein
MMKNKMSIFAISLCLAGWCAAVQAASIAYWRHEEGAPGGLIAAGPDSVLDSSGNGNHMRTWDPAFTSASYTSTVSPLPLRSGLANTRSLDFGPGGDDPWLNDDNYSDGKPMNGLKLGEMTAEVAFNMDSVGPGQWQSVFGKDGMPTASPVPPLAMKIRGDDFPGGIPQQLFIEWMDGDGDVHFLASGKTMTVGDWNHIAFVLTATDAELWVAGETSPYTMLASISGADFAGPSGEVLIDSNTNYSIGRGMWNGGVADWSNALIDEVRISDIALSSSEFLFIAVPEPSALVLGLFGVFGLGVWRRRGG